MRNFILQILSIIAIIILVIIAFLLFNNNRNLKREKTELELLYKQSIIAVDSLNDICNSHLLVDNISPIVISTIDEKTGKQIKRIYFVIRKCMINKSVLTIGTLDTLSWIVKDTLFDISVKDTILNYYQVPEELSLNLLEGSVSFYLPNVGFQFAFSEKKKPWWRTEE